MPMARGSATPRDRGGHPCRCQRSRRSGSNQNIGAGVDQYLGDAGQSLGALLGPAIKDHEVGAVDPAKRTKPVAERVEKVPACQPRPSADQADSRRISRSEDRLPGRHRAHGEQHEFAAPHVWMAPAPQEIVIGEVQSSFAIIR